MLFISCSLHGEVIQPVVIDIVGCSVCFVSSNTYLPTDAHKFLELIELYRELWNLRVILFSLIKKLQDVLKQFKNVF